MNAAAQGSSASEHSTPVTRESAVPFIQYWDSNVPGAIRELLDGMADVNCAFDYHCYNDESAHDFVKDVYGSDVLKQFETCALPAMRADLFRYCFLLHRGGLYIDADYRAVSPAIELTRQQYRGILFQRARGLANGLMYFRDAGDPLAAAVLEKALDNIRTRSSNSVFEVTGPKVLRTVYAEPSNKAMFDGYHFVEEEEFARYFETVSYLDYKRKDTHWCVARDKGITIFRDQP